MGTKLAEVKDILPPTVENLTAEGTMLESVSNNGTKRARTGDGSLLSDALEDIRHTIFLPNICGSFEVTMCTGALFYFYFYYYVPSAGDLGVGSLSLTCLCMDDLHVRDSELNGMRGGIRKLANPFRNPFSMEMSK